MKLSQDNLEGLLDSLDDLSEIARAANLPMDMQLSLVSAYVSLSDYIDEHYPEAYPMPVYVATTREQILSNPSLDVRPVNDWNVR